MHLRCAVSSKCDTLRIYVNSMPFMADMGTHADNCKRILFFTRSTVDQVRIHTRNFSGSFTSSSPLWSGRVGPGAGQV